MPINFHKMVKTTPGVQTLSEIADRIRSLVSNSYIEIGYELLKAKEMLPHGEFGKWLKAEFGQSPKSAQRMMNAATLAKTKSDKVSSLSPSALYELASKSTPEVVQDEVIAALDLGKKATKAEIVEKVKAYKEATTVSKASEIVSEEPAADDDDDWQQESETVQNEVTMLKSGQYVFNILEVMIGECEPLEHFVLELQHCDLQDFCEAATTWLTDYQSGKEAT